MAKSNNGLDVACSFRKVSGGEKGSIKLGVSVAKGLMKPNDADRIFCHTRLDLVLALDPGADGDTDGQQQIEGAETVERRVNCTAECKGVSLQNKHFAFNLKIDDPGDDIFAELWHFQDGAGRLAVTNMKAIKQKPRGRKSKDVDGQQTLDEKGNAGDINPK